MRFCRLPPWRDGCMLKSLSRQPHMQASLCHKTTNSREGPVMKKVVFALLAIPLFASCSNKDTSTGVEEPAGSITDFRVDHSRFGFTVNTERGPRIVTAELDGARIVAAIERPAGQLLFEVSAELDEDSMIFSERTESDRLWFKQTRIANRVLEHFNLNGRELVVTYPSFDAVTMSKSFTLYQNGEHERVHPELLQAFSAFDKFYRTDNSLHWNVDGETLIATLLSPELAEEVRVAAAELGRGERPEAILEHKEISLWCASVGVATGLKCFFGGAANAFCLVGTAHSIACGLFELYCGLWSC
jgi:hypothetical protein